MIHRKEIRVRVENNSMYSKNIFLNHSTFTTKVVDPDPQDPYRVPGSASIRPGSGFDDKIKV